MSTLYPNSKPFIKNRYEILAFFHCKKKNNVVEKESLCQILEDFDFGHRCHNLSHAKQFPNDSGRKSTQTGESIIQY